MALILKIKSAVTALPLLWELIDVQNIMIEKVSQNVRPWRDCHTGHNLMHGSKNQCTSEDDAEDLEESEADADSTGQFGFTVDKFGELGVAPGFVLFFG